MIHTKRILFFFAVLILTTFTAFSVNAQSGSVSGSTTSGEKGQTVSVSINLNSNPGIYGLTLSVNYDNSALTLTEYTVGSIFPNGGEVTQPPNLASGNVVFVGSRNEISNTTATGTHLNLNFSINEAAEENKGYTISLSVLDAINADGAKIQFTSSAGMINVVGCQHENAQWRTVTEMSCTVDGVDELYCADCDTVIETKTTPATHQWNEHYTTITEKTCTEDGLEHIVCSVCGEAKEGSERVIPASHEWNDYYSTITAATCSEDGEEAIFCSVCDEMQSGSNRVIPAAHKWNDYYTTIEEATCTENGSEHIVCSVCGEVKDGSEREITASHDFTKEVISIETLKSNGDDDNPAEYYYTCNVCGEISDSLFFTSEQKINTNIEYTVKNGNGIAVRPDEDDEYTLEVEADSSLFEDLIINGSVVSDTYYEVANVDESTFITISNEFLKTLEVGVQEVLVNFSDGTAMLSFTIKEVTITPSPSPTAKPTASPSPDITPTPKPEADEGNFILDIILYVGIIISLIIVVFLIIIVYKRMKKDDGERYK